MDTTGALVGTLLFVLVILVVYTFFLYGLQRTLEIISPENRTMRPGQVWLVLIPFFGLVWTFIMVSRISQSLANEFESKKITPDNPRPGYTIGLIMSIVSVLGLLPSVVGTVVSIGGIIFWIIYWVKITGYREQLRRMQNVL